MRYVPITSLVEGMVVARNLYDGQQKLLIRAGSQVKESYIKKLEVAGVQGLYIHDQLSEDIEIKDIIHDSLRKKALETIKDVFIHSFNTTNYKEQVVQLENSRQVISKIVEDIMTHKDAIVNLIDLKIYDDYTYYHSVNAAVLSIVLGLAYGLDKQQLIELGLGAILHDIGKLFVDKEILNKKGQLTKEEFEHLKKHAEFGYHYLRETYNIPMASYVGVLQHHEHFDGSGYPHRKVGNEISLYGRIICIADVYDALTSTRPYRGSIPPSEAMEFIMANGGRLFDPALVEIFIRKVAPYPIGTTVELSNGFIGIVLQNYEEACMRPTVRIIKAPNNKTIKPFELNLNDQKRYRNITIVNQQRKVKDA